MHLYKSKTQYDFIAVATFCPASVNKTRIPGTTRTLILGTTSTFGLPGRQTHCFEGDPIKFDSPGMVTAARQLLAGEIIQWGVKVLIYKNSRTCAALPAIDAEIHVNSTTIFSSIKICSFQALMAGRAAMYD